MQQAHILIMSCGCLFCSMLLDLLYHCCACGELSKSALSPRSLPADLNFFYLAVRLTHQNILAPQEMLQAWGQTYL